MASKWLPGYTYDVSSGRYRRADTGRFVKRDTITDLLETSISQRARDIRKGFETVLNEELGITPWLHRTAQQLKREHLELAALAAGGWDRLTPADYTRIEGRLNFDFKHLANMAREISEGAVSLAQGLNRLDMYLGSARREYLDVERNGRLARVKDGYALIAKRFLGYAEHCPDCQTMALWPWRPADVVPIPGEGSACMTNCRCTIEYKETSLAYMEMAEGGPGSGNWGHAGVPGRHGGSAPRGTGMSTRTGATARARREEARAGGYTTKGRGETDYETEMRNEIVGAEQAASEARASGNDDEANAIAEYADSMRQTLEEERSANQALWDATRKTPEQATETDWEAAAKRLDREAQDAYKKYTQEGIQLATDIKRGAVDSGYMNVGGESVMVKRGKFSRNEASRMRGEVWSQAKEELYGRMGGLLQKAGYRAREIAKANYEQRQKLLAEIGQGDLARSGRGKVSTIDDVGPDVRGRVRQSVSPILASRCALAGDSPLNLPGIGAYDKMALADRIRSTKVGGYE